MHYFNLSNTINFFQSNSFIKLNTFKSQLNTACIHHFQKEFPIELYVMLPKNKRWSIGHLKIDGY